MYFSNEHCNKKLDISNVKFKGGEQSNIKQ